jgi:hypothetical protein
MKRAVLYVDPVTGEVKKSEPTINQDFDEVTEGERVQMSETESCPHGHGKLKRWEGELRCWSCGWPDMKKTSKDSTLGTFFSRLFYRLFYFLIMGPLGVFFLFNVSNGEGLPNIPGAVAGLVLTGGSLFIAYEIFQILCAGPKRFRDLKLMNLRN